MISLISVLSYFILSAVLTLVWPYYLQDDHAAFPHVFEELGWTSIKWVVTIGSTCALSTTMFGSMYTVPRVIYAMANDGLIFKYLSKVHPVTRTPLIATLSSGLIAGLITTFVDLVQLVDFSTIGALLSYSTVAVSVLLLRFDAEGDKYSKDNGVGVISETNLWQKLYNVKKQTVPTKTTSKIANWSTALYVVTSVLFCMILCHGSRIFSNTWYYVCITCTFACVVLLVFILSRQPQCDTKSHFKVPFTPLVPCLSVMFNTYLMIELSVVTWIGFSVWLLIGCLVYFSYGIRHSEENTRP
ncbi:hypothetical protein JTB14_008643 [Gonioctena quinquepunctata]|nr:hypothetical protein JTB14_008643 [Gonioctena quinquepunctata]